MFESEQLLFILANTAFLLAAYFAIRFWIGRSNRNLKKIIKVQDVISAAPIDLDPTLQIILDQLMEITNSSGAAIEMVEGDEIFYRASAGTLKGFKDYRMKYMNSLSGYCIAHGEIVNCTDTEKDNRVNNEATRKFNIRSMVVAPLMHEEERIGVLKVSSERVNAFDKKDIEAVEILSKVIGPSIAQKQDYEANRALLAQAAHMTSENLSRSSENRQ